MNAEHVEEYKKLGLNIAYYRKLKGIPQERLAEKINISTVHMSRIETSYCGISLDRVFDIAKALDIEVYKLFEFR